MRKDTDKAIQDMDRLIGQMSDMLAKAERHPAAKQGDRIQQMRVSAASDQIEALLAQTRKYRAWLKIMALVAKAQTPLKALEGHMEVEAVASLVELVKGLHEFGEAEICPLKDFDNLMDVKGLDHG